MWMQNSCVFPRYFFLALLYHKMIPWLAPRFRRVQCVCYFEWCLYSLYTDKFLLTLWKNEREILLLEAKSARINVISITEFRRELTEKNIDVGIATFVISFPHTSAIQCILINVCHFTHTHTTHTHTRTRVRIYIYIYIYILFEFFTGLSLESEWQQVSSSLQESFKSVKNNALCTRKHTNDKILYLWNKSWVKTHASGFHVSNSSVSLHRCRRLNTWSELEILILFYFTWNIVIIFAFFVPREQYFADLRHC